MECPLECPSECPSSGFPSGCPSAACCRVQPAHLLHPSELKALEVLPSVDRAARHRLAGCLGRQAAHLERLPSLAERPAVAQQELGVMAASLVHHPECCQVAALVLPWAACPEADLVVGPLEDRPAVHPSASDRAEGPAAGRAAVLASDSSACNTCDASEL